MGRLLLVLLSLIGVIGSAAVALLVVKHPEVVPMMPEAGIHHQPPPFVLMVLVGGYALIALGMLFWMPAPWFYTMFGILGTRRRRCNWALTAGCIVGAVAAVACGSLLITRQMHAPVAMMKDGHFLLRQDFQTIRELSVGEYTQLHAAQQRLPNVGELLVGSAFALFAYLSAFLYALWYIRVSPQIDWRDGFWEQFIR
jgi:hypothetical protein